MLRQVTEGNESESAVYTTPNGDGRALIYLRTFPVTEGQRSWLRGHGFQELAITFEDLEELLRKGEADAKREAARLIAG